MSFSIISGGFLLFFTCFLMHLFIWRLHHPKRQILTLFSLFLLVPILLDFLSYILKTPWEGFPQVYLLHLALSLAYILTYPAAQAGCPSFIILLILKYSMPEGVTKEEIYSYCLDNQLFDPHIGDLVNEKFVADKNGWLELTKKGRWLLKIFITFRKLFGLSIGKG